MFLDTKKTWNSTVVVPRFEAFALPIILEQQREAHAEMYVYLCTTRDAINYDSTRHVTKHPCRTSNVAKFRI